MDLSDYTLDTIHKNGEFVLCRGHKRTGTSPHPPSVLVLMLRSDYPRAETIRMMQQEHSLRVELDSAWAVRAIELTQHEGRTILVLEDPGGETLDRLLGTPIELGQLLRLAVSLSAALGQLHARGLIHKNIKPANVMIEPTTGRAWLMGFGITSRLPRERQSPGPPELIAGTLAYMAPEQTGRMNRSIDSRSDLYALGVVLYEILTGRLPFTASDPMEWVHCHIARQPVPPAEQRKNVPRAVSAIIMKLLAKTAEERYQTAAGVESDLRRCLAEWEAARRIDEFPLCENDRPDRLLIPEKLYGRAREIETLLASFDRVVASGTPELVLVSGYSGIGKSSVVNELHKVLVPPRGLFASGKFDQYKRDIPYSTLAQAFQSLIRRLLGKSEADLAAWRDALREALGPNGRLMIDLVPELKLIIGEQPPVPELSPQDAQKRFHLVFRRFIGVFARPEHPLALFLDDLQWLDAATLDLFEDLLTQADVQQLLVIGAYRDNEVDAAHPLTRKLDAIRQAGTHVQEIHLTPLGHGDLTQLIVDTLRCGPGTAAPLARLVHEKTAGNPFFVIQFLYALAEEGLLTFDHDSGCWFWDLDRIHAKGYTDNVADLMVGKLTRLPVETQKALQQLACLGNIAEINLLSIVLETSEEQVHAALWPALRMDFVERTASAYRFVHDRVQEAAHSLMPMELRAVAHLRIGRLLLAQTPPDKRKEAIFEIVNQLNRGAALIGEQEEREQLAELNLIAGRRAKASTAYASALNHLIAGAAFIPENCWEHCRELAFELEINRAECEFLTGQSSAAEQRLDALSKRAVTTVERAAVACLRMDVCTTLDQSGRAVAVCLEYLRHVGIEWSPHPTEEEARREYERVWFQLGSRMIEDLTDLPVMEDRASLATIDVLTKVLPPALFTDANLACLTICRAVSLSLERGYCDASCFAYVMLGRIAGPRFGDYKAGFRFGQLGYELVERRGIKRFEASTYLCFAIFVVPWMKHVRACRDLLRRAFEAASRIGDLTYGAYTCSNLDANLLFAGDPLSEVQHEAEHGLAFAEKARFGLAIDIFTTQLALIRMLRGFTPKFGCLDDGQLNELRIEHHLSSSPVLAIGACWYWIRKLQARYVAGDYATAMDAASRAQGLLWTTSSFLEEAEYHFYSALLRAVLWDSAEPDQRRQHAAALAAHSRQLRIWAENCPENFENRAALVDAEIARIEGRDLDAMRLYEEAIRSARANGFVQNEALANEIAACFFEARGFERIAQTYLRDARYCYLRWGASGKVRQLDQLYPQLSEEEPAPDSRRTIDAPIEQFDLATVLKISQAVSGEIVLEKLIDALLRTALEHAGAQRGLLILPRGSELRIQAEATTVGNSVAVALRDAPISSAELPEPIVQYAARTQESIILDDASARGSFTSDPYICREQARSILCLPLVKQGRLIAVLYLENKLTANVFTLARIALLNVLASAAAISLENSRLYEDLRGENAERKRADEELRATETRFRTFVDHATDAFFVHDGGELGKIIDVNRQACESLGYTREELIGMTPLDFDPNVDKPFLRGLLDRINAGEIVSFETSHRRKDGTVFPVEVRVRPFRHSGRQLVLSLARDITERKRAEQSLRRSEQMYSKLVNSLNGIVWQADAVTFQFSYVSPQAERILGYPLAQWFTPNFWAEHIHPEDVEWCVRFCKEATEDRRDHDFEYRMIAADGCTVWLRDLVNVQTEPDGAVCLRGVMIDVTARKRAEEALRKSEHLLQNIIDTSTAVIYVKDRQGQYLLINRRFEELFHVTREEIAGKTDYDLFPKDRADAFQVFDQRVLALGSVMETEELVPHDDGLHTYISIKAPLRDEQGKPYAVCGISTDISERKRLQDQLREAQKMEAMGQLAGGVAHDFNNLMTIITGYSDLLHRALGNDPPLQEKVDEIYKAGEQATWLTRQLLAFSRRQVVQPKVLDLNDVLGQMAKMLRRLLSEDIDLKIVPDAGACPIHCDPGQIQQVVINLAINARDAMPNGGELLLSTENVTVDAAGAQAAGVSPASYVRLSVSDTGVGMDSETKAHIFEPFFTTKEVGKGTGLGLATVHGIVQQAGGSVTAESAVGKGTTFQVLFPRAKQPVEISKLLRDRPAAVALHGCETILLVEDQDGLRKLLTEILEKHGYRVLAAANGQEALRILQTREQKIAVMITDLVMPQMGGRELVEQLPARHSETKVLFMSGYADKNWQSDNTGIQHAFIDKPFQPEAMLRKIREILDQEAESRRSA